ncbi:probable dolichyl pyrophosphate Man9GlcNAc2 alpha-1,3-glucosyltransferase [Physella acuta]|uniref:probable dolichyl pyrophosphate Man9GlcNAc2 alpha-1,3-glucosyltransferase n=1 Tax=Physella acuta TaxID=109671 RepID=UPI0027DD4B6A|nr:probable dolichyl pyrophosphate Man9GlcNAc2 alpha-1,3-glucosyltransferase [Physella acuta]
MDFSTYYKYSKNFYIQLVLGLVVASTVRICVSMWGHSGENKPPMYGDFEAQRHWMEITVNLPTNEWYKNTSDNDLQYWGLDYPPLTAYHMFINGKIAQIVNSSFVELEKSRGIEGTNVKYFMRITVLVMDILVLMPTVAAFFMMHKSHQEGETEILTNIIVMLGYPGLILIDNGHFQYNNVSLSLFVLATLALIKKYDLFASALFCLALNYKQMELYHALPFFAYLFGSLIKQPISQGMFKFTSLAMVVVITFVVIWSPFLQSKETALSVLQRLFPVNRGLYEDKVANFWCAVSVIIKFKQIFSQFDMALICLAVTSLFLLPSFLHLIQNPSIRNFQFATINSALVFFLFSFHVHEKTILLAAIPSCLVLQSDPLGIIWFLLITVFSMLPLLIKDGLILPTIATVCLFWIYINHFLKPAKDVPDNVVQIFQYSLLMACCIFLATVFIPPPSQYPDLFPMIISIYSCGHFIMFAFYFHYKQYEEILQLEESKGNDFYDNKKTGSWEAGPSNYPKTLRNRNTKS